MHVAAVDTDPILSTSGSSSPDGRQDQGPPGTLSAVVLHARRVTSRARADYAEALTPLAAHPGVIVLRTCHRVEVYLSRSAGAVLLPRPPGGAVELGDAEAVRHLVAVACGLESAVLGEDQVMHQIRQTHTARRAAGPLDPVLDRLFQTALHAGRRAHGWFGPSRRSLADVALETLASHAGDLRGREVLVVGAGSMAALTVRGATRRGIRVAVTNRTAARALLLAGDVEGRLVPWGATGALDRLAGVVVAVSGGWPLTDEAQRELLAAGIPVVDLSSPPATPEEVQVGLGPRFHGVDDLAWSDDVSISPALRSKLEGWVGEQGRDFCRWLRAREHQPTISALTAAAEARRAEELAWLDKRLPDMDERTREAVEQMTHRLVADILHGPRRALRVDERGDLDRVVREMFGLALDDDSSAAQPRMPARS